MSQRHGENGLQIEVAYATPERQFLKALVVAPGTSIAAAIEASDIKAAFPDTDFASLAVGIWGNVASRNAALRDGDRIELYRPLPIDPRDARRRVASAGGFMGQPRSDSD